MRWVLGSLLVILVGCGPSQKDLDDAVARERKIAADKLREQEKAQAKALAAQNCANREAQIATEHRNSILHSKQVIMTTLESVSNSAGNDEVAAAMEFAITIKALDPKEWRWVEVENSAAVTGSDAGSLRDRINYSVNPAELSSRVQLVSYGGLPAVRFDCVSGNCIRAIGRRLVHYNGEEAFQDIDEGRANNIWALGTDNRAQVVRDALADLILKGNNPPVAGSCGGAETATL
jgi:hypothetical protein